MTRTTDADRLKADLREADEQLADLRDRQDDLAADGDYNAASALNPKINNLAAHASQMLDQLAAAEEAQAADPSIAAARGR